MSPFCPHLILAFLLPPLFSTCTMYLRRFVPTCLRILAIGRLTPCTCPSLIGGQRCGLRKRCRDPESSWTGTTYLPTLGRL
ncbi:hypothetical protein LX32DRAFT_647374, partial [Colletotrichum zoysiae]